MKVSLIQCDLVWENVSANLRHIEQLIAAQILNHDLIVLPEMFSTGFTMNPEQMAEEQGGSAFRWMQQMASKYSCVVCGSVSVKDNASFYNRLYWVNADGTWKHYDKRHLFRMAKEDAHYQMGTAKIFPKHKEFTICPLVCYDLRFPVWSRNTFTKNASTIGGTWAYDLLIYVANWPEVRNYPWKQLAIARAIENQCYVLAVNRVGTDGNGFKHSGDSMIIGPKGEILASIAPHHEGVLHFELDAQALSLFRAQFPVGLDADEFMLN
jgi:predicted amidohydrolase